MSTSQRIKTIDFFCVDEKKYTKETPFGAGKQIYYA